MDWEKWRKEEDARQQDIAQVQELRRLLGLKNRSRLAFWFDMMTTGTIILVSIGLLMVSLPSIIEHYRNEPTLWSSELHSMKHLVVPTILACLASIILYILFDRKK